MLVSVHPLTEPVDLSWQDVLIIYCYCEAAYINSRLIFLEIIDREYSRNSDTLDAKSQCVLYCESSEFQYIVESLYTIAANLGNSLVPIFLVANQ